MPKLGKLKTRFKIQRALNVELPGLGKPGALERRAYPPGQHGFRRRKISEYALRLREKQKVMFHYCLREEQLRRFVIKAKRGKSSNWMNTLVQDLELRLDNLVFRLGFASSILASRQMVRHGKVKVNGKTVDIPSYITKPKDKITLTVEAYKGTVYLQSKQNPRLPLATYLSRDESSEGDIGSIDALPTFEDIPFSLEQNLVIEYYSKVRP
ncbi:MAG: 30S ribosomal protein S4 [Oligoflexia bacterium]|nr:30S ribosomal protein S4 [Oligoflexia bacterium]